MIFNKHSTVEGRHAFLSPSKYHWMNYDDEKLQQTFTAAMAAKRGTELHALAHELIRLRVKLPRNNATLSLYVNDCIGYRMTPEQILFYSENCFGTADAISFLKNALRIFDYKSGVSPTSVHQLEVYAALFCLEYGVKPMSIQYDLRIYQSDEVKQFETDPDAIAHLMAKIISFDRMIDQIRLEAGV